MALLCFVLLFFFWLVLAEISWSFIRILRTMQTTIIMINSATNVIIRFILRMAFVFSTNRLMNKCVACFHLFRKMLTQTTVQVNSLSMENCLAGGGFNSTLASIVFAFVLFVCMCMCVFSCALNHFASQWLSNICTFPMWFDVQNVRQAIR